MSAHSPDVPEFMAASIYRGQSCVRTEQVPVPAIGPGEILVRVESCGICHTDLKKIEYNLLEPPRIYGHETAGVVAAIGESVEKFRPGDRVCLFHHIPCLDCFYCRHRNYAQCETYKRVGITAGFEPAGGGFAQYVRVMDWIVNRGVEKIPDGASFERASFVEPVNTCLKAVEQCAIEPEETVLVMGQGPIGLIFTHLLHVRGVQRIFATDLLSARLELSAGFGATEAWNPCGTDIPSQTRQRTAGRGADVAIVAAAAPGIVEQAVAASRPGARILLFAQTSVKETFTLDGAAICAQERTVFGSYSASIDLQQESARLVWDEAFPAGDLISHRLPLDRMNEGIRMARQPGNGTLKVIVHPQR